MRSNDFDPAGQRDSAVQRPRRQLLRLLAGGSTIVALGALGWPYAGAQAASDVLIEAFSAGGKSQGISRVPKLVQTEAQWRARLSPDSFVITRQAGTEPAFAGATWNNHADGLYRCICCDTALFDSRTKFESGTGWPSFWQPISKSNVRQINDSSYGMVRTAVSCQRCDAHLGHVFDDGPKPTGLRYCMNSGAMKFAPRGA